MDYQVRIVHRPAQQVAVVRFHTTLAELGTRMAAGFADVMASLSRHDTQPTGPALAYYEKEADGFAVAVGFPVAAELPEDGPVGTMRLPEADVATTTHVGRYEDLPHAYAALEQQAAAEGRKLDQKSGMWEEYWSPPGTPEDQTRTEVFWPVTAI
jgi:effector-binding domain-containing protein